MAGLIGTTTVITNLQFNQVPWLIIFEKKIFINLTIFLQSSTDGNSTLSVLKLVPTMDDLGGQLSCRANNPLIDGSTIQDKVNLKIDCKSN